MAQYFSHIPFVANMLKILQIALSIFLALATTLGSGGLMLHKMACFQSGKVVFSVEGNFECAPDENDLGQSFSAVCCDFDQLEFTVSSFDHQKIDFQFLIPDVPQLVFKLAEFATAYQPVLYEKLIPPLPQHQRLARLCSYII